MNYAQSKTLNIIEKTMKANHSRVRMIKIHGSKYQEAGLPDVIVLTETDRYWLEVKRNWKDEPTKLQKWNIENLRSFGWITGFVVGNEFSAIWGEVPMDLNVMIEYWN